MEFTPSTLTTTTSPLGVQYLVTVMNGFSNGDGHFNDHHHMHHRDDLDEDAIDFGGPGWDSSMIEMPYMDHDSNSAMLMSGVNGNGMNGASLNNKPAAHQSIAADSPQGYDPSSEVSSPGLSDHNVDSLSATSLDDRNDFDNLINYDGTAHIDRGDLMRKFAGKNTSTAVVSLRKRSWAMLITLK